TNPVLRRAVRQWISQRVAASSSNEDQRGRGESPASRGPVRVRVRELRTEGSSTAVGQAGSCAPLRQWLALHEALEIARYQRSLDGLERELRASAQELLAGAQGWRDLADVPSADGASVEPAALARCQTAAASLHGRLEACVADEQACVDGPMISLDGAITLTRVDPWYPDRATCREQIGAPLEALEASMEQLAVRAVTIVNDTPALGALDRLARTRALIDAVEDLCVPRRREVRPREVEALNDLLDMYADAYAIAATQSPTMARSEGIVYVAGRGTLMELGRTTPTSAARQLEAVVHEFRTRSERLGRCEAASHQPLELTVLRAGEELLRAVVFPEQLGCDLTDARPVTSRR
ncbi:MAG: hypothetical protein ACPHRO_12415, partial [Nannocystaceae bacterium]